MVMEAEDQGEQKLKANEKVMTEPLDLRTILWWRYDYFLLTFLTYLMLQNCELQNSRQNELAVYFMEFKLYVIYVCVFCNLSQAIRVTT